MAITIREILCDARTEWALRWTALVAAGYAVFFYAPATLPGGNSTAIDWTLPVQLITGGELAFYNAGWLYFFAIGSAVAMLMAFALLSAVFDFVREDKLGPAYAVLMTLLTILLAMPLFSNTLIGVLNNLNAISLLLIVIFVEVMYGPVLNFAPVLDSHADMWEQIFQPTVLATFFYLFFAMAIFAIPPWHSGSQQSFGLVSSVLSGLAGIMDASVEKLLQCGTQTNGQQGNDTEEGIHSGTNDSESVEIFLEKQSTLILKMTNSAGLKVPVSLYGEQGLFQWHVLYPLASLGRMQPERLGRLLDQTAFHTALILFALSKDKVLDSLRQDAGLLDAVVQLLRAASAVLQASAVAIQRDRCSWNYPQDDWREKVRLLWPFVMNATAAQNDDVGTTTARRKFETTSEQLTACTESFHQALEQSLNASGAAIVRAAFQDYTSGNPTLLKEDAIVLANQQGSVGCMAATIAQTQTSWYGKDTFKSLLRLFFRFSFLESIYVLITTSLREGCHATKAFLSGGSRSGKKSLLDRREARRAVQYMLGMWGLYAMATWWTSYSTLLGSSSTGQWTMVAFFVCFRATAEETFNAAIIRAMGHSAGAMLSWGVNAGIESSYGRMLCHLAVSLVVTWWIPPPFVYPSSISFRLDGFLGDFLSGLATTYHLTSVLVFSTDIESAAKARALSQCIGAATAAVIAVTILPWFGVSQAQKTADSFSKECRLVAESLGEDKKTWNIVDLVNDLLSARRDFASVQDSKGWLISLSSICGHGFDSAMQDQSRNKLLRAQLDSTAISAFAWHALNEHCKSYSKARGDDSDAILHEVGQSLANADFKQALSCVWQTILECPINRKDAQDELCRIYLNICIIRDCGNMLKD